jgi:hypothetical protein
MNVRVYQGIGTLNVNTGRGSEVKAHHGDFICEFPDGNVVLSPVQAAALGVTAPPVSDSDQLPLEAEGRGDISEDDAAGLNSAHASSAAQSLAGASSSGSGSTGAAGQDPNDLSQFDKK